jgi:hypothetical protein
LPGTPGATGTGVTALGDALGDALGGAALAGGATVVPDDVASGASLPGLCGAGGFSGAALGVWARATWTTKMSGSDNRILRLVVRFMPRTFQQNSAWPQLEGTLHKATAFVVTASV